MLQTSFYFFDVVHKFSLGFINLKINLIWFKNEICLNIEDWVENKLYLI